MVDKNAMCPVQLGGRYMIYAPLSVVVLKYMRTYQWLQTS